MTDDLHDLPGPLMALHDQLVDAADRRSTAKPVAPVRSIGSARSKTSGARLLLSAAAALVLGIGIVGYTLGVGDEQVSATVDVEQSGNQVTVSIDEDVNPASLEKALLDAGVDVVVQPTPTGPSRVNRFVGITSPAAATLIGGDGTVSNRAQFTAGQKVTINLGVPAEGRMYDAATRATDVGEPLEGSTFDGKRFGDVQSEIESRAAAHGATVVYWGPTGRPTEPAPNGKVLSTQATAADTVIVVVG